jgi:hypothetical protein
LPHICHCNDFSFASYLDGLGRVVLGAPEYEALRNALAAQLVDLHHPAEGDQPDESILRQKTQRHLEKELKLTKRVLSNKLPEGTEIGGHYGSTLISKNVFCEGRELSQVNRVVRQNSYGYNICSTSPWLGTTSLGQKSVGGTSWLKVSSSHIFV